MFVFLHIPKTAGQTLMSIIEDQHMAHGSVFKRDEWNPAAAAHNVTSQRPRRADISPDALQAIQERTVFDRQLYDYGVELFRERVAAQGPGFADDLRWFQERNRRFGAWHVRRAAVLRALRQAGRFASDRLPRRVLRIPKRRMA